MVIITAGMIGVGKTTLTAKIADHLHTKAFFEPVGENPVLPLYYKDPKQYGFLLQIYFLNKRFSMIKQALSDDNNVLDRSIYEDALFTKENNAEGNISDTELDVYLKLLDNMMSDLNKLPKKAPDLMVYSETSFETFSTESKNGAATMNRSTTTLSLRTTTTKCGAPIKTGIKNTMPVLR